MQKKIRILVVDDHTIMLEALSQMLGKEPDFEIVGVAADGGEAVNLAEEIKPDIILMDIGMPIMDGIEATRIISKEFPSIKIIGLSMYKEDECGNEIRAAGAVGYVCKTEKKNKLLATIRDSLQAPAE